MRFSLGKTKLDALSIIGCFLLGLYTALAVAWLRRYNAGYLLWFCDVALLLTGLGLLFRNAMLVTAELTAVLVFHLAWNVDFWLYLLFGYSLTGATQYMFYPELSLTEKALSFFSHVFVVPAALYGAYVLGAPRRAWLLQWVQTLLVFLMTYLLTRPEENINWMFGTVLPGLSPAVIPPVFYYALMVAGPPLLVYGPTNRLVTLLIHGHGQKSSRRVPGRCPSLTETSGLAAGFPLGLSPAGAAIAVLLAAVISLGVAQAADRKCTLGSALFEIAEDGKSALERMPARNVCAHVDHIVFGDPQVARERLYSHGTGRSFQNNGLAWIGNCTSIPRACCWASMRSESRRCRKR